MATYYYCCSALLDAGSIIKPGNWGRIIKKYTQTPQLGNPWVLIMELIFEQVRREYFPLKPSRFDSNFLCFSYPEILDFRKTTNRWLDLIYEVDLLDENAASHIADWSLINVQPTDNYATFVEKAKLYWRGQNIATKELVTTSRIRVVRALEEN